MGVVLNTCQDSHKKRAPHPAACDAISLTQSSFCGAIFERVNSPATDFASSIL